MTVSAPAERPRILAALAERPWQTAYEIAAALGYCKPESRTLAELVSRMHRGGILIADTEVRPATGRPARIYSIAPPGTPPVRQEESPAEAERRRERERVRQRERRARAAGKTLGAEVLTRMNARLPASPPAWDLPGKPACSGADLDVFFGPDHEPDRDRRRRVAKARAVCFACPVRSVCLDAALARGERWGVWGGADLETERGQRSPRTTRPDVAASGRA